MVLKIFRRRYNTSEKNPPLSLKQYIQKYKNSEKFTISFSSSSSFVVELINVSNYFKDNKNGFFSEQNWEKNLEN